MTHDFKAALEDIEDNIHPNGTISVMGGIQLLSEDTMNTIIFALSWRRRQIEPQPVYSVFGLTTTRFIQ